MKNLPKPLIPLVRSAEAVLARIPGPYHLAIAVSGGRDSVALLHTLSQMKDGGLLPRCQGLIVVHLNHGLRGKESSGDQAFVKALAKSLKIPFRTKTVRWAKGETVGQLKAREVRREFFREILAKNKDSWILLGHHQDDQAETIFQRILRGTGVRGLRGMRDLDPVQGIARPFLSLKHSQIQSSSSALGWEHREDSSNQSLKYERNWIRHRIFPELEKRRPGLSQRLAALAENLRPMGERSEAAAALCALGAYAGGRIFSREALLERADRGQLHEDFSLERKQLRELLRLLKEGNGRFASGGWAFHASLNFVWVREKGAKSEAPKVSREGNWKSALGDWSAKAELMPWTAGVGGGWKRKLQKAGVPEFLRGEIPIATIGDTKQILLPNRGGDFHYTPSPLARVLFAKWKKKSGA